jgi:GNAT superfamily N-acetyltransferase
VATESRIHIRPLAPSDFAGFGALFEEYMRETYADLWRGSPERLSRDAMGQKCSVLVAVAEDTLVGLFAWTSSYDLHHCVPGADALDLYVVPAWRGRGIALLLGCAAAAQISRDGGLYLKGSVVQSGAAHHLYRRFGVCDGAGCIVSGRAFRQLAELAGRSDRELLNMLPDPSWNYEA